VGAALSFCFSASSSLEPQPMIVRAAKRANN
jgi:hypothetical protein